MVARLEEKYAAVTTAKDCVALQAQNPDTVKCLLRIQRESNDEGRNLKKTLATLIYATDKFLHLKEGMSNEEIFFTAESIISEYGGQITFADIKVILNDAKRGKYGKMYERLSCATILDWFSQYIDQRLAAAEQFSISQARRTYGTPQNRLKGSPSQLDVDKDNEYMRIKQELIQKIMTQQENDRNE